MFVTKVEMASDPEHPLPSLEAFEQAAQGGGHIAAVRQAGKVEVVAVGRTADDRKVTWVPTDDPAAVGDAVRLFMGRLRESFGPSIGESVARTVGLRPGDGPLEAASVLRAIEMASASIGAFRGVNFVSRHALGAAAGTPEFRAAARQAGIDVARLTNEQRLGADALFRRRFDFAADGDRRCVDLPRARELMAAALREVQAMDAAGLAAIAGAPPLPGGRAAG